jgi:hypothetical protein
MVEETQPSEDHHDPLKTLMKQVITVVEKGTELVKKISNIAFCIYGHQS